MICKNAAANHSNTNCELARFKPQSLLAVMASAAGFDILFSATF